MKFPALKAGAALVLSAGVSVILISVPQPRSAPLWPGARFSYQDRARAVERGLRFIHQIARDPKHFQLWGHDLLWCFYTIWASAQDPALRRLAWELGHEHALEWRRLHSAVPPHLSAEELTDLVEGSDSADWLGVPDSGLREQLHRAAARFSPTDVFGFDPAREPPPSDIPKDCGHCGKRNPRGARQCSRCGAPLKMQSPYEIWYDALVTAHAGRHYGIVLGSPLDDVVRWLPVMRPYRARQEKDPDEFFDTVYAITHVIYTLNDYHQVHIAPGCLPQEFDYLRASLAGALKLHDPDMLGEYLDTLKAFGLTMSDPLLRQAEEFLLATQNPDGSWGDMKDPDVYGRYHPTWAAVDGLREYQWSGGYLTCTF
jgi:hypothetical protein